MKTIEELLFGLRDAEYAAFQAKLTPSVDKDLFIGVRVPEVRKLILIGTCSDNPNMFAAVSPVGNIFALSRLAT